LHCIFSIYQNALLSENGLHTQIVFDGNLAKLNGPIVHKNMSFTVSSHKIILIKLCVGVMNLKETDCEGVDWIHLAQDED
jgi:hypothetical protein